MRRLCGLCAFGPRTKGGRRHYRAATFMFTRRLQEFDESSVEVGEEGLSLFDRHDRSLHRNILAQPTRLSRRRGGGGVESCGGGGGGGGGERWPRARGCEGEARRGWEGVDGWRGEVYA